jgi:hydrogenase maturation protein HypF
LTNVSENPLKRAVITVEGTVQGVGFRPYVFNLANELELAGHVCNKGGVVEVELVGTQSLIDAFLYRMPKEAPPLAKLVKVACETSDHPGERAGTFLIRESERVLGTSAEVPPDVATCADCLSEMFSAGDRRYRYPFINCTNCGPRFTIISNLPYDRNATSMSCFPMCAPCRQEYENPLNRRFHAQPNACRTCGPSLAFTSNARIGETIEFISGNDEQAIEQTMVAIRNGLIVAVKGLGGFHLVCDATNDGAVNRLRARKRREAKPFAVMMTDLQMVQRYCNLKKQEAELLSSHSRPIVLLEKKDDSQRSDTPDSISQSVAPCSLTLGVMLPYTPLQNILMEDFGKPLVMTSANLSEEPIAAGNREALKKLSAIADAFLLNNRDIVTRYDDSVTRISAGRTILIRRARSYAPQPIALEFHSEVPILAVGGHLKNTFCLLQGNRAYVSQHLGDLDMLQSIETFEATLDSYQKLFGVKPAVIAHDMHPDYGSTKLVADWMNHRQRAPFNVEEIRQVIPVQHHFAHIVSCMAEHDLDETVIGVAFDGIGFGTDGNLWGGEFLVCDSMQFQRRASFQTVKMPGGVKAIKEPWRMALSYLKDLDPESSRSLETFRAGLCDTIGEGIVNSVSNLSHSPASPDTSSCGRLFDAAAALLKLCETVQYEGQAAVLLEQEANRLDRQAICSPYDFRLANAGPDELLEVQTISILEGMLRDIDEGKNNQLIAGRFHETIARIIRNVCNHIRSERSLNKVCLSGGVFQNSRLLNRTLALLAEDNFECYFNSVVPTNDGGISLGQAVVAAKQVLKRTPVLR